MILIEKRKQIMEISLFYKRSQKKSVITSETDRAHGLFWTESSSQLCHISTRQKY